MRCCCQHSRNLFSWESNRVCAQQTAAAAEAAAEVASMSLQQHVISADEAVARPQKGVGMGRDRAENQARNKSETCRVGKQAHGKQTADSGQRTIDSGQCTE